MSEKELSILGVSNKIQSGSLSPPVQMALGPFTEKHSFYYVTQPNLLCRALLSKLKGLIHLAANGDLILEFPDQPESYLLCSLQSVFDIEEEELQ